MEKKNMVILTVIAVATLLIAVVGATFAYFAVKNPSNVGSTIVDSITNPVPTIGIAQNNSSMSMSITADQMVKGAANVSYWAKAGTNQAASTVRGTDPTIATVTTVGGIKTDNYDCTVTIKITTTDANGVLAGLKTGHVKLYLNGLNLSEASSPKTGIEINDTNIKTLTSTITLPGDGGSSSLTAALEIINDINLDQSNAAGKTLTVKIDTSLSNCHLKTN